MTVVQALTTVPVFPDRSSAQLRQGFRQDILKLTDKAFYKCRKKIIPNITQNM
jgi:hypothetical protein